MEGVAMGVIVVGASVLLLQVEVTQADGQAGVVRFTPQGGGAHCGERAWTQAVGRNNLTLWKGRERKGSGNETEREEQLIAVLLCFALISNLPEELWR